LSFVNEHASIFYCAITFYLLGWCLNSSKPLLWAAVLLLIDYVISNFGYYAGLYTTAHNIIIDALFALAYVCFWAYYSDKLFLWMLGITIAVIAWHFGNEFLIEIGRFGYLLGINLLFLAKAACIWKVRHAAT